MAYGTVNVGQQPQNTIELATESKDGLMSAADKKKLDGIPTDAVSIKIANGTMEISQKIAKTGA